jgi:DNA (cytosine-5)-methyltransferase 1
MRAKLNVVELYAGTARSFEPFRSWKRCQLSLLVDNNLTAAKTYLHNFPGAPYLLADLKRARPDRVANLLGQKRADILLGCPPCQGYSDVGSRDPADPRNSHIFRFGIFAKHLRPLAIAMENVPLAASTRQFRYFVKMIEREGYAWTAGILNAALRGSSQCRQRLVYIAIRDDLKTVPEIPSPSHGGQRRYFSYATSLYRTVEDARVEMLGEAPATQRMHKHVPYKEERLGKNDIPTVGEVIGGLPRIGSPKADRLNHRAWAHTRRQLRRMSSVPEGGQWPGGLEHYSNSYGRLHRRGLARTITTYFGNPGSGRFWHPKANRALTLREAARIQGFPDSFQFIQPYSHAADLVGNALDATIAAVVFRVIRDCLD